MSGLEVGEDIALQRTTWAFERAGWAVLALVVAAAALGVFGGGPLSEARSASADGALAVEYQRFARVQSPERLRVRLARLETAGGRLELQMDSAYLERVTVTAVTPEPESVALGAGRVTYAFALDGSAGAATVTLEVEAEKAGPARTTVAVGDVGVPVEQFFFP